VAGSQERFVEQMNLKGAQLGFRGTVFTNPHGLHDPAQMTTARDMAKLLAYATTIDGFAPFFAATSYTVPKTNLSEERELSSTNYMMIPEKKLYYDSRVTGGRTGITDDRKRTLAVTAKTDDLHYAAVILSAVPVFEDDGYTVKYFGTYEEMGELLDMGFDGYRRTQVLMPGQVLMQCDVANGANAVAAMSEDTVTIVLPSGITMDQLQVHYSENISNLNAPIEAGKKLSEVQIWYNNICVAVSSVIAGNSSSYDSNVVMEHDASSGNVLTVILTVLGILVLIAAIIAAVLFGMRYVRIAGARMQRRRRSAARRRSR